MMKLKFNNVQRVGLFITILMTLAIVMLHYPFGGYANNTYYEENNNRYLCPKLEDLEKEEQLAGRKYTDEEMAQKVEYCYEGEYKKRPFSELQTNEPIYYWFGSVIHTLSALIFCLLAGFMFILTFKDRKNISD